MLRKDQQHLTKHRKYGNNISKYSRYSRYSRYSTYSKPSFSSSYSNTDLIDFITQDKV